MQIKLILWGSIYLKFSRIEIVAFLDKYHHFYFHAWNKKYFILLKGAFALLKMQKILGLITSIIVEFCCMCLIAIYLFVW